MRHRNAGNKLGVSGPQRKALLRGLTLALLERDSIHTTRARAKELRWWADHAVTLAKRGDVAGRRQLISLLGCTETHRPGENRVRLALTRLYGTIAPRFRDRSGGYTQIIRLALPRAGDCAEMCIMRYIPSVEDSKKTSKKGKKGEGSKEEKKSAPVKVSAKEKSAAPRGAAKAEDQTSILKKKSKTPAEV